MWYTILKLTFLLLLACFEIECNKECDCRPLKQCSSFLRYYMSLKKPLSKTSIDLLRSKQCGIQDNFIKVCCNATSTTTTTNKTSPRLKCEEAICLSLKNCTHVMDFVNVIEKPLNICVVNYLREQQCGFQGGFPKICCKPLPNYLKNQVQYKSKSKPKPIKEFAAIDEDLIENKIGTTQLSVPQTTPKWKKKKVDYDDFNRQFSELFEDDDSFELLFRRQRSLDGNTFLNVEIR